jgi:DNA-binding NarL/FixJ family response regulator
MSSWIAHSAADSSGMVSYGRAARTADLEVDVAVRVFLVEDQKPMQELIRSLLDAVGGFELVGLAASETQATEWLLRHQGEWDLAIFDLLLAEGSGFTLVSRCARERSGTVLVFSDFVTPAVEQRCMRLGADGVISKARFGELRAWLEAFPGRVREEEPA